MYSISSVVKFIETNDGAPRVGDVRCAGIKCSALHFHVVPTSTVSAQAAKLPEVVEREPGDLHRLSDTSLRL